MLPAMIVAPVHKVMPLDATDKLIKPSPGSEAGLKKQETEKPSKLEPTPVKEKKKKHEL
jgi:hypothetical protein